MSVDFNTINGKFSQMASQFQSPALVGAADEIKNEFQAKAESMFGKVGELEDTYETLTANLSGDALEKALKDMAGEVKGGMQAIGPVASDLVDKVKILEPQIAKATQEIADKLFISVKTVERHRTNLFIKTNSKNVVGLVLFALKFQLVEKNSI